MNIRFLGAARTVTGSKYVVAHQNSRVMVDCGLFQGWKNLRLKNWEPFPFPPKELQALVLSHAHLDHSGYLPLLVRSGFQGPIYATSATRDLAEILLLDSGYLQEEEARFANRMGFSKHHPALPLYTREDAEFAMRSFVVVEPKTSVKVGSDLDFEFTPNGHILGSSSVRLRCNGRSLLFSGDLGRPQDPILRAPEVPVGGTDYLVVESTYGNRIHHKSDPEETLREVIERTIARGGSVLIPSFAVGRAQSVLYCLMRLRDRGLFKDVPIFLNSPMASRVNEVFCKHWGETRLSESEARRVCEMAEVVTSVEESIELNQLSGPKIIIAASGMATGGRVLHHLKSMTPDSRNTIVFAGFQAGGTRGEAMVNGAQEIKIHGEFWPIRSEVVNLDSFSAHADSVELLAWIESLKIKPTKVFITHGEPLAAESFKSLLESHLGLDCEIPQLLSDYPL